MHIGTLVESIHCNKYTHLPGQDIELWSEDNYYKRHQNDLTEREMVNNKASGRSPSQTTSSHQSRQTVRQYII